MLFTAEYNLDHDHRFIKALKANGINLISFTSPFLRPYLIAEERN